MLIRITNQCFMSCTHCMINSTPNGEHMDIHTFVEALEFSTEFDPSLIFISGGEPTSHPLFSEFALIAKEYAQKTATKIVLVASNGMFLEDEDYTKKLLSIGLCFQITNDPRFYPKQIKKVNHPALMYENNISIVSPFGRAVQNNLTISKQGPMCFNLRSLCSHYNNFKASVIHLRSLLKMCSPSINIDGTVSAGETPFCYKIGTIKSKDNELIHNINNMKCGQCGLHKGLSDSYAKCWSKLENQGK